MKILALEFSSGQRSVAAVRPGARSDACVDCEIIDTGPGTGGAIKMVAEVLHGSSLGREAIEAIAIGIGPGSYTGIRAAISFAQGWQLARGVKLVGISSAEVIAAQAWSDRWRGRVNVVIDAQRGEFYLAGYELAEEGWREVEPLRLVALPEVQRREQAGESLIGPEATRWAASGRIVFPRATTVGKLALSRNTFVAGEKLEPIYLRETTFVKAPPPRFG